MGYYFENSQSMFSHVGASADRTLDAIVRRYIGANPPHPLTYRAYSKRGILRDKDYRYHADFSKVFPKARDEQFVYAWAKLWSDAPAQLMFDITCFGPMTVFANGQEAWRSNIFTERYADAKHRVTLAQQAGWNHYVIRFKKTRGGFGGIFGSWLGKHPYTFMIPSADRDGQEGWLFTEPTSDTIDQVNENGRNWLPDAEWDKKHQKMRQLQRIFGKKPGAVAFGWTKGFFTQPGAGKYKLTGSHKGPITVFVGDEKVFRAKGSGKISATISAPFGSQDVLVKSNSEGNDWGFDISIGDVKFSSPCNIAGSDQVWMYTGPFKASTKIELNDLRDLHKLHPAMDGEAYWRLDLPDTWVRAYNENPLWGRWNYPLGVTLYGVLQSGRVLGSLETEKYVVDHMQFCADTFPYALWDRDQFGGATGVHSLLTSIDSLDDCGSFGSAFLEVARDYPIRGFRQIADYVADFISNKQDRQPDGTFYRLKMMHIFHEQTMWADDQYMSVPFLCRYYQLTEDEKYIDDAANQVLGFKKRLFIPELKVMSHIYDLRRNMATGVPWGRGNGWTIFSLSELLAVLPKTHPKWPEVLKFFRELAEGYLALQDKDGMWHQVLTHPDSYPESSCTSMFAYAFARGVRFGWLQKPQPYVKAVFKAWEGLNKISIDKGGNIYGVCRGSEFSFSPEYYKKELPWNLNDTHGVGIVLLAGVEVLKLTDFLHSRSREKSK
jgi:rhamnogalacturonyl hydrolase YesR